MVYITRREKFSAAHRLFRRDWSDDKNAAVFGKCSNPNWHGHNYELFVTVKGEQDSETSFVTNLTALSAILKEKVISKLDHKNINLDVDFMQDKIASTERLAVEIWKQIEVPISKLGCKLHCIKIQETENNSIEYYGN